MLSSLFVLLSSWLLLASVSVQGQTCNGPVIATCDTTLQSAAVPQPWYNLDFASAPTGALATNVPYQATSTEPNGCYVHQGVVQIGSGGGASGSANGYIDLYNSSSPQAYAGNQLPGVFGGPSAGSQAAGTAGWSLELTWKPTAQLAWAKILNIGVQAAVSCFQIESNGNPSNAVNTQFTQYDATQTAGYYNTMGVTTLNQWYHVVVVLQQATPTISTQVQANWFIWTNGALQTTNYGAYQYYPQAVLRTQAYLGRSLWNGDPLYQGLVDSFRIYNYALTGQQVGALYQAAMGGCTVNYQSTVSAPTGSALYPNFPLQSSPSPPSPTYSATFASQTAAPGSGYQWLQYDQEDVQCGINQYHMGLVRLSDETQISVDGGDNVGGFQYVDLAATSGNNAIANPLTSTTIGTVDTTQALGSLGFSMEIVFKPQLSAQWAKLIDFGSYPAPCNNDVVFGWDNTNAVWQLDYCNSQGGQWQIYDVGGVQPGTQGGFVSGSWYHAVIVFQQLTTATNLSNWYVFVNNQLVSTMSNTLMPQPATRQDVWLGRSGWNDTLWSGEIDTFNYYNQALGPQQISTLYTAAMGPQGTQACTYTAYTTPLIPQNALFYSQTFATDPRTGNGGAPNASSAGYGWKQTDTQNGNNNVVQGTHSGILVLNGCTTNGTCPTPQYVNLSAASGPFSLGMNNVLPSFGGFTPGGAASFDLGNVGWSFEITWMAYQQQTWAKLFDFGTGNTGGQWDVLYGWNGGNQYFSVDVTNYYDTQSQIAINPVINYNTWYHTVWVIQSASGMTSAANFFVYVNGQLTGTATPGTSNGNPNTQFPPLVRRASSLLGKSNWGDPYFVGEIDTFNIYSIALNPNQVNTLYEAASNPGGVKTNFSCVGAGYDLSAVGNQDYFLNANGYSWVVHPCGYIDIGTCAPGASFCQNNNVVSYFEPTLNPILWQRITGGVQLSVTDGYQCGGAAFGRTAVVRFICAEDATVPYLANVIEVVTCTYVAEIFTIAACQPPNSALITAVNEPFPSPMCGGGLYDLSTLNNQDLTYTGGGYNWWLRPCAAVSNASCAGAQPTSFCQSGGPYSVANYLGGNATTNGQTTVYTLTQQNGNYGLQMQIADGTLCGAMPRVGIINLVCNPSATTAYITSIVESPIIYCHYTATVQTSVVCGQPNQVSATGGSMAPTLSNSAPPNGYAVTCGGEGFDVSASNIDMFYQQQGGYTFYVHPCGNILGRSPCPAGTSMCQVTNDGTYTYYVASRWNSAAAAMAQWVALPNGVQMTIATGDSCGGAAINRYAVYNFVCDQSATSPQLAYVYEIETCHYEAWIATNQACTQYQALLPSNANVNSTFTSNVCGGGVYPLSALSNTEMYLNGSATGSPFSYVVRPCGTVQNPNCGGLATSFCQFQGQPPNTNTPYSVAQWKTSNTFNQWTTTANGITLVIQDGSTCQVINNPPRQGIFQFVCNATATTPYLTSVAELETCHYTAVIQTNLACPNMLQLATSSPVPGASSSTGSNNNGGGGGGGGGGGNGRSSSSSSGGSASTGSNGGGGGGGGGVSNAGGSTSNSLSGGKLAAAIVVPIIGALLLACLCFVLGRAMSGGGKGGKEEGVSRNTNAHQPHYDEPSQMAGEQSTNGPGVEMA